MSGGPYGRGKAPERACMKIVDWPATNRAQWLAALAPANPFEPDAGARCAHAVISNRKTEKGYGRWLTWLSATGHLDPCQPPSSRITAARVQAYVQALGRLGNASQSILARLQELGEAARVFDAGADWSFIKLAASRVRANGKSVRDKRAKLVLTNELFDLGKALMISAASRSTPIKAATTFRDGLTISLLALRPLRRKNLAGLTIDHSLVAGPGGWMIRFDAQQMKNPCGDRRALARGSRRASQDLS